MCPTPTAATATKPAAAAAPAKVPAPKTPDSYVDFFLHPEYRPDVRAPVAGDLPFTLADVKKAIPAHCFEASMFWSWFYIVRDLAQFAAAAAVTYGLLAHVVPQDMAWARAAVWAMYALVQGSTGFGIWVIGHECGHQAYFGNRRTLNDVVGYVIHTLMLAPYHAWRITHATHHKYTNHKQKDTAFVAKNAPAWFYEACEFFPPLHCVFVLSYLVLGWPLYLMFNWEGFDYEGKAPSHPNHFNPFAPMFRPQERSLIVISDLGFFGVLAAAAYASWTYGAATVGLWYGLPLLVTYAFLVLVTFLQHADKRAPHYDDDDEFDFLKGALATVDRNYGPWNAWMHHITDAHVVHHLFSHMPFYHAKVATPYVKALCGEHYLYDSRPLPVQLWESWFVHQSSHLSSKKWIARQKAAGKAK